MPKDDEYEDESPTQRGTHAAPARLNAASSDRPLLTVLMGVNAGQVFTLDRDETSIGRGRDAHVMLDDLGVSRRHARIVRTEGRRYFLEDLGSANGVFVDGRPIERVELRDGDRVQIGAAFILRFGLIAADEEALARRLYESSTRDALTGLYNRKYASERLAAEVAFAQRHATRFSVALFDLDHFKRINDTHGHQAGDGVLRVVAAQVQKVIRGEDVLARYGGEEFIMLVRGIAPKGVGAMAERVRGAVERLSIPWESGVLKATVSVGVASLAECGPKPTAEAVVALADARLYKAKDGGRNRVCSLDT
jgi:diguanylate cyclase (GGDEF)-like protein